MQYKGYTLIIGESAIYIYGSNGLITKTETVDEAYALIDLTMNWSAKSTKHKNNTKKFN